VDRVGGDHKVARGGTLAEDELADEALLGAAVSEDPQKGASPRLAHALTGKRPDDVVGADGEHVLQAQAMQGKCEVPTLAIQAVGQHD
jgi:hypothetical protein